jgi:hypothetical protein
LLAFGIGNRQADAPIGSRCREYVETMMQTSRSGPSDANQSARLVFLLLVKVSELQDEWVTNSQLTTWRTIAIIVPELHALTLRCGYPQIFYY